VLVAAECFGAERADVFQLGGRLLGRHLSVELGRPVEVRFGHTEHHVRSELAAGAVDVALLTGDELASRGRTGAGLEPVMQSGAGAGPASVWVVLARTPFRPAAFTHGHVVVAGGGEGDLPALWLDGWRRAGGLKWDPAPSTHRLSREPRPAVALMRTFFGKADACVVPESVFIEACAQNPEVGTRLQRLASSPVLPGAVVAVGRRDGVEMAGVRRAVERLAGTPRGASLASLLRSPGFVPFVAKDWPAVAGLISSDPSVTAPAPAALADGFLREPVSSSPQ